MATSSQKQALVIHFVLCHLIKWTTNNNNRRLMIDFEVFENFYIDGYQNIEMSFRILLEVERIEGFDNKIENTRFHLKTNILK